MNLNRIFIRFRIVDLKLKMRRMNKIKLLLLLALLGVCNKIALSQVTNSDSGASKVHVMAGLGMGMTPQYEGSDDFLIIPALAISANWNSGRYIRLAGMGINANILSSKKWEFGPRVGFKLPRNESFVDNARIADLEEIDFAISSGLFASYKFGNGFEIEANYTHDISGVNEGGLANLEIGYTRRMKRFIMGISIHTSYATKEYMKTYFSVNPNNIGTSTLTFYDTDEGIKDIGASLTITYMVNKKWMIAGRFSCKTLLDNAADSPIVLGENENQYSAGLVIMYKF